MMRTLITIFFLTITSICIGQPKNHADLFDFNLKGEPKSIKEISIFSLSDTSFFNYPYDLSKTSMIDEYQFDSVGNIVKERHKWFLSPPLDRWIDYSQKEAFDYKDSVVTIYTFPGETSQIRRYYDEQGYLIKKISNFNRDTTTYLRDSNHRIKSSYEYYCGIDTEEIIEKQNEYYSNGDIQKEKRYIKSFGASYQECGPSIQNTVSEFKYIYDSRNNWIIKITYENDEISLITQREIKYE